MHEQAQKRLEMWNCKIMELWSCGVVKLRSCGVAENAPCPGWQMPEANCQVHMSVLDKLK